MEKIYAIIEGREKDMGWCLVYKPLTLKTNSVKELREVLFAAEADDKGVAYDIATDSIKDDGTFRVLIWQKSEDSKNQCMVCILDELEKLDNKENGEIKNPKFLALRGPFEWIEFTVEKDYDNWIYCDLLTTYKRLCTLM